MRIVIPSKKYQGAPNSDITVQAGLNVTKREFVEGDRTVLLNLAERFDKERQSSDSIRVAGKITKGDVLQVQLVPGTYKIEAMVMLDKRTIIPAERRDDFTTPMIDLKPPYLWGGLEIDEFVIRENKLYEYDEIQFAVISFPTPTMYEHLQWLDYVEGESEKYKLVLKPKFREKVVVENEQT